MKPIWYFVGLILIIMGAIICISGLMNLVSPAGHVSILHEMHPSIWWGGIMVVVGIIYLIYNKNKTVE